jgi:hypothetical protein
VSEPKTHPLEWVSLGFAVVALSYTEWSLAVAAGAHPLVAVAVPGALDIYAIRAMRARRHVPVVVLAMVGVNALSYLVHAGVLAMTWPVLVVVSAIAPLTFWAVHALGHGNHVADMEEARKRALWDVPAEAVLPEHARAQTPSFEEHVNTLPVLVPDAVPADWSAAVLPLPVLTEPKHAPEHDVSATVLPLPPGFTDEHMQRARLLDGVAMAEHKRHVHVRVLKEELRLGTPRATRIRHALEESCTDTFPHEHIGDTRS